MMPNQIAGLLISFAIAVLLGGSLGLAVSWTLISLAWRCF